MSQKRTSVVVASADRLFADAAAAYVDGRPGFKTEATVFDGVRALTLVGRLRPQALLILGDQLPRLGPAPLSREVARRWPLTAVVILGGAEEDLATVLPADADGPAVLEALGSAPERGATEQAPPRADGVARLRSLTSREREILSLLTTGAARSRIAAKLGISEHTVRTHTQNLYAKLDCHSRLDVVRFAADLGLMSAPSSP